MFPFVFDNMKHARRSSKDSKTCVDEEEDEEEADNQTQRECQENMEEEDDCIPKIIPQIISLDSLRIHSKEKIGQWIK